MSVYVHLLVSFRCEENEGVAERAKKHLLTTQRDGEKEAVQFLEA